MKRVKSRYSKKTSPLRSKKSVMVILPRVDVSELLRERRRRSLSLQQNTSSTSNASCSQSVVSIPSTSNNGRIHKRRFPVKREPPCIFHSSIDLNENDDSIEEIPGVLGDACNPALCLHEITRSMCYMCSPHPAEDKSQVWNEIEERPAPTNAYRSWHVPTPFVSNSNAGRVPVLVNAEPQSAQSFRTVEATTDARNTAEINVPIQNNSSIVRSCESIGVGTENDKETRDQPTQTIRYFPCKTCPALFTEVMHLVHHKTVHQKMFECPFCTANFVAKNDLKSHIKLHMLPKYYDCVYCSQTFTKKHDIRDHLSLHAEQKLFLCQLCPAKFTQKINLRNHEQSHNVSKFIHVFKKVNDDGAEPATSPKKIRRSGSMSGAKKVAQTTPRPTSYLELASITDSLIPRRSDITASTSVSVSTNTTECAVLPEVGSNANFFKCKFCIFSSKQLHKLKHHQVCHFRKTGKYTCTACGAKFLKKLGLVSHQKYSHTMG